MQDTIVMAFRKRLKKRGYSEISIYKRADGAAYDVTAREPLTGAKVSGIFTLSDMYRKFK